MAPTQLMGHPWAPKIDQRCSFSAKWRLRDYFFARFLQLAVFSRFLRRRGSILEGPNPEKVMTFTGMSHFFDFQKIRKKRTTGIPKWTPNSQELVKKPAKTTKMAQESSFLRDRIFSIFSSGQKIEKRGHAHIWQVSSPGPWAPVGDYRGNN